MANVRSYPLIQEVYPPKFRNLDNMPVYEYLEELSRFQMIRCASDEEMLTQVIPWSLRGFAFRWFKFHMEINPIRSMNDFQARFRLEFESLETKERIRQDFQRRTQDINEKLTSYIVVVHDYFQRLNEKPSDDEMIKAIIVRLNPSYLPYFQCSSWFRSMHEFYKEAERVDALMEKCRNYKPPPKTYLDPSLAPRRTLPHREVYTTGTVSNSHQQARFGSRISYSDKENRSEGKVYIPNRQDCKSDNDFGLKNIDSDKQNLKQEYLPSIYGGQTERSKSVSKISLVLQPSKKVAKIEGCKNIKKHCKYFKNDEILRCYNKGEISQFHLQTRSATTGKTYKNGPSYLKERPNSHERLEDTVVSSRKPEIGYSYHSLQDHISSSQCIAAANTPKNYKSRFKPVYGKHEE